MRLRLASRQPALDGLEAMHLREAVLAHRKFWLRELRPVARYAWLFGSVARSEATKDSDVDLLVLTEVDDLQLQRVAARLTTLVGRPVDLIAARTLRHAADPNFAQRFARDCVALRRPLRPCYPVIK